MDGATAADRAYEIVRTRILSGQYAPRQHLRENVLAADAGVSRTPVREALKRLSAEQYVVFVPNRGAFVADRPAEATEDAVAIRAMVEAYGAELAAVRIAAAELEQLETIAARIEERRTAKGVVRGNNAPSLAVEFQLSVCRAARSETLAAVLRILLNKPPMASCFARYSSADWDLARDYRRELIRALRARDARAASCLMSALVLQSGRVLQELMPSQQSSTAATPGRPTLSMLLP